MELIQYHPTIPPDSLRMESTFIREDCFDEEFFIPSTLFCEELDRALYRLFFLDIDHRKILDHITLVLYPTRKKREKISHRLYPCFAQFFHICIRGMEE